MPIPPVRTQKRIAAELEKKIKHCDKLVKKVKKAIDDLNVQRHTILQKSFDGIGFYATENKLHFKGRKVVRIKECGLVQAGKTPTGSIRQYFGKEFTFFNPGALEQGINIVNSKTYLYLQGVFRKQDHSKPIQYSFVMRALNSEKPELQEQ